MAFAPSVLACATRPTRLGDIEIIADGRIADSWAIACHLSRRAFRTGRASAGSAARP
jgi:hypothetical protein